MNQIWGFSAIAPQKTQAEINGFAFRGFAFRGFAFLATSYPFA